MSDNGSVTANRDDRLAEVLDAYLEALKAGVAPDTDELLARYPDLAEDLKECLASLAFIRQVEVSANGSPGDGEEMPAADDHAGTLGDFRLLREVGRGGMGVVYEAEQLSLKRRVALKVLPFAATMDPRHLQRFHNEAQAAACLHHTNIVPVFSVGSERGVHFYAMQFIDGQPLSDIIRQLHQAEKKTPAAAGETRTIVYQPAPGDAPTPPPAADLTPLTGEGRRGRDYFRKVAELGVQAAEALDHAHQLGIVHRDIKPANLLLDARGNVWVTDFGLAHMQQSEANLTMTGEMVGTLRYMSPEQALARRVPIDHRTDVYSLGATLYELLTLRPAFGSTDRQELLRQIAWEEPSRPRRLERDIPAELEIIVLKAMEKRPQDRYATAQELADDLRRFLDHRPIHARPPSLAQRVMKWTRRHRGVARAVFVCLSAALVVEAISTVLIWQEKEQTRAALQTAGRNREEAERQRREAIENVKDAQAAMEQLIRVGRERLADVPNMEPVRSELAAEGVRFYRDFLQKKNTSPEMRLIAARAHIDLGVIQRQLGNLREGNQNIKKGVDLASELLAARPDWPECLDVLAVGWNNLAEEKLDTNQVVEAQEAFEKARDIETRLVSDHPDCRIYQEHLAKFCNNLGSVHARQGQGEAAERCFRQALRWRDKLAADAPDDGNLQEMLAMLQANLSTLHAERGEENEAFQLLSEAVKVQEKIVPRANNPRPRVFLAQLYQKQGEMQMKRGPYPQAFETFKKALDVRYKLNVEFPTVPGYAHDYARALQFVGERTASQGQDRAALELLTNAEDLYRRLAQRYPKTKAYQQDLASCCCGRGHLLAASYNPQVRKPASAIEPAQKAVEIDPDIGRYWTTLGMAYYRAERWEDAHKALKEAGKRPQPVGRTDLFFLAMTHWKLGHREEARQQYDEAEVWRRQHAAKIAPLAQISREAAQLLAGPDPAR